MTQRRYDPFTPRRVQGRLADKPAPVKADNTAELLETLASLFDWAKSARLVENGGLGPKPRRCSRSIQGDKPCGLPLRADERTGCAFHKAAHNFEALGLTPDDIYEGTPQEADIRARLASLKAKV